jgi:hypothetical protein
MSRPMRNQRDTIRLSGNDHMLAAALIASALLAACGRSAQNPDATRAVHQAQTSAASAAKSAAAATDQDMVSAVSAAGASTTPISVKFRLESRPTVTTPVQLTVSVIPSADVLIRHMLISFQPGDGLQLQSPRSLDVSDPSAQAPIVQQLTLVPQQHGVLSLNATVLVDTDSGSISRTYSIPLIAIDSRT